MSVEIKHRQADIEDARAVAHLMREADRQEVIAMGERPDDAIAMAIYMSVGDAWVTTFDGEIACVWGVVPVSFLTGCAIPWLLTTYEVEKHKKVFFKESRRIVRLLRKKYVKLSNMIDVRYDRSINWARRLGFTVSEPEPHGPRGVPFRRITMEA